MSGGARLRLVLASANPDKVTEIAAILGDALHVELVPRPPEVPDVVEDGVTLLDNARLVRRVQIINGRRPETIAAALAGEHVGTIVRAA